MKVPRRFVTKLSLGTILAASAGLGWAAPEIMAGTVNPLAPTISFQTVGGNVSGNSAIFRLQPHPFVAALVTAAPLGVVSVAGIAAEYGFIVNGPHAANLDLTIKVSYEFEGMITDAAEQIDDTSVGVHTSVTFDKPFPPLLQQDFDGFANQLPATAQIVTDRFEIDSVAPGIAHLVGMLADIGFSDRLDNPLAFGHAVADPVITFAPGFDSTGFSLEFAPGVGNEPDTASAVPEPSSLIVSSILLATFGVVQSRGIRRRARPRRRSE